MTEGVDESKRSTLRRFAALGAAGSLAGLAGRSRGSEPPADGPEGAAAADASSPDADGERTLSRDAIAGYVSATPGAHFSKLRDDLHLATGEAQHHLRRLEADGTVESRRDGEYRRYYPADRFSAFEQVALGYLRRETPRGIVLALLEDPDATGGEIAQDVGVSAATVSAAAADLEAAGLLTRVDGYALVRPETLLVLVVRYADSFGPEAVALAERAETLIAYDPYPDAVSPSERHR